MFPQVSNGIIPPDLNYFSPTSYDELTDMRSSITPSVLKKLVHNDLGLAPHQKKSLFTVVNSPEVVEHMLAGTAGAALAVTISKYMDTSKTTRALLGLAGFGIGNILYNTLQERKFTEYDPDTGIVTLKRL